MTSATEGAPAPAPQSSAGDNGAPAPETAAPDPDLPDNPGQTLVSGDPANLRLGEPVRDDSTPAPSTAPKAEEGQVGSFGDSGDPAMNLVYRFVEKAGFTPDDAEIKAVIDSGDFSLLRAKLASMGDKAQGWQEYIGIAERHFQNENQKQLDRISAIEDSVFNAVGGKEQWIQIQAWASANADEDEKRAFNAMLNADPIQAKVAARQIAEYYYNAHGHTKEPENTISYRATQGQSGQTYALSPDEYVAAVQDLARKVGSGRIDNHPDYEKLKQRRAAWRG